MAGFNRETNFVWVCVIVCRWLYVRVGLDTATQLVVYVNNVEVNTFAVPPVSPPRFQLRHRMRQLIFLCSPGGGVTRLQIDSIAVTLTRQLAERFLLFLQRIRLFILSLYTKRNINIF